MARIVFAVLCFIGTAFGSENTWEEFDFSQVDQGKVYYGDVYGDTAVYAAGRACDYVWDIITIDLKQPTQKKAVKRLVQNGIDNFPRIDGNILVWCGGPVWQKPWMHEPSNFSVFVRNIITGKQKILREYTMSESYSHPAVSGNKAVWIEHLNLDTKPKGSKAKNWWNTSFNICGADISNIEKPVYFTIAKDTGKRDPYPCHSYTSCYDGVIDICNNIVVWEAGGDIYGADISDLKDIRVFTICDHKSGQYNPVISGKLVVWTDKRNDEGDIYGANISDLNKIKVSALVKEKDSQMQPAIDGDKMVYVSSGDNWEIKICQISDDLKTTKIKLKKKYYGAAPSIHKNTVVWQGLNTSRGKAMGIRKLVLTEK